MRTTFTILLLLISTFAFSQTFPKIEGIGKFKINRTTISIIDSIKNELNIPVVIYSDYKSVNSKIANVIAEIIADSTKESKVFAHPYASFCQNTRIFLIGSYYISGIELVNVILKFQDDILIEIRCDYSKELNNALEIKYGKPEIDKIEFSSSCKSDIGETLKNQSYLTKWKNGSIEATMSYNEFYDYQCNKKTRFSFYVEDTIKTKKESECDKYSWDQLKARKEQRARAKLKDF